MADDFNYHLFDGRIIENLNTDKIISQHLFDYPLPLVVTAAPAGWTNDIIGIANANISKINGIAIASISKVNTT